MEAVPSLLLLLSTLGECSNFLGTPFQALETCEANFVHPGNGTASVATHSLLDCLSVCSRDASCAAVNACSDSADVVSCQQLPNMAEDCSSLQAAPGCTYITKSCVHGWWEAAAERCHCQEGYAGSACHRLIRDCAEGYQLGLRGIRFNFPIQPNGSPQPFPVFCFFGYGGITVFLRRNASCADPEDIFRQSWSRLKSPIGDCNCHCFVGLENLYHLLRQRKYNLKVHAHWDDEQSDTYYNNATIGDEASRYSFYFGAAHWNAFPLTEDGFLPEGNRKFCTLDNDCGACAVTAGHAGWFDDGSGTPCPEANGFGTQPLWPVYDKLQNLTMYSLELLVA